MLKLKYKCSRCGVLCVIDEFKFTKTDLLRWEFCSNNNICNNKIFLFFIIKNIFKESKYIIKLLKDERDYVYYVNICNFKEEQEILDISIVAFSSLDNLWILNEKIKEKDYVDYKMLFFILEEDGYKIDKNKKKIIRIYKEENRDDYEYTIGYIEKYAIINNF